MQKSVLLVLDGSFMDSIDSTIMSVSMNPDSPNARQAGMVSIGQPVQQMQQQQPYYAQPPPQPPHMAMVPQPIPFQPAAVIPPTEAEPGPILPTTVEASTPVATAEAVIPKCDPEAVSSLVETDVTAPVESTIPIQEPPAPQVAVKEEVPIVPEQPTSLIGLDAVEENGTSTPTGPGKRTRTKSTKPKAKSKAKKDPDAWMDDDAMSPTGGDTYEEVN